MQRIKNLFIQHVDIPAGKLLVVKCNMAAGFPVEKKVSIINILSPVLIIIFLTLAGCGSTGETPVYPITTYGSITFKWEAPTTTVNGDPLTNMDNYIIYYGTSTGIYTNSVDVGTNQFGYPVCVDIGGSVTECTYTLTDIPVRDYYFTVTAYDIGGHISHYSNEVFGTPV